MAPALPLLTVHPSAPEMTMELETLRDLYVEELKDLYSAEKQIIKGLAKMTKAASHPESSRLSRDTPR